MARKFISGYTLLEVSIVVTLMAGLFLITATVMIRGMQVVGTQNAYADVSDALRTASLTVSNELAGAVLSDVPGNNTVKGLAISGAKSDSLTFQVPLSLAGTTFSSPITIRVRNEDTNGNMVLDPGEDLDKNGVLDRVIERQQDLNGDGFYNQPGETNVLARNIDSISYTRVPGSHLIVATVTARSSIITAGATRILQKSAQFSIFVRN